MMSNDSIKKDTRIAIIKTNIVAVDKKEVLATKVSFKQE